MMSGCNNQVETITLRIFLDVTFPLFAVTGQRNTDLVPSGLNRSRSRSRSRAIDLPPRDELFLVSSRKHTARSEEERKLIPPRRLKSPLAGYIKAIIETLLMQFSCLSLRRLIHRALTGQICNKLIEKHAHSIDIICARKSLLHGLQKFATPQIDT